MLSQHFQQVFKQNKQPFGKIIGQDKAKHQIKSALMCGRHLILIGPPGIGKTTIAKTIAQLLPEHSQDKFVRVQGSPDLTAEDLLGDIDPIKAMEFGPLSKEAFTPGKIFKADGGLLFFDEVNRAPAKLQNALLQVLEEGHATIGAYDVDFPTNFIFIGTMNPQDNTTEELSHVFLDRFDMVTMHYPQTFGDEAKIIKENGAQLGVEVPEGIVRFVATFIHKLRTNDKVDQPPSVRASLGLYERAQANALLDHVNKVEYRHVFQAIESVLPHRISLKASIKYLTTPKQFVHEQLKTYAQAHDLEDELEEGDVP